MWLFKMEIWNARNFSAKISIASIFTFGPRTQIFSHQGIGPDSVFLQSTKLNAHRLRLETDVRENACAELRHQVKLHRSALELAREASVSTEDGSEKNAAHVL